MSHGLFSPYQHRASTVHRLPAAAKLGAALAVVLTTVALPRSAWTAFAALASMPLAAAVLSRVSLPLLFKRLLLIEPFVLGIALLSLFQRDGLQVFLAMIAKSTICVFCMIVLSMTTRFSDILAVLTRCRVPALLVTTLALMHRYMIVLADEMKRMIRARACRTFRPGRARAWWSSATVLAHLFVRTSERAERVYDAMCARGWKT
ncbi:MAG: cobalt ECF transporter T component CbiQ [bacterium]